MIFIPVRSYTSNLIEINNTGKRKKENFLIVNSSPASSSKFRITYYLKENGGADEEYKNNLREKKMGKEKKICG